VAAIAHVQQAYRALLAMHSTQEQALGALPEAVRSKLLFPDLASMAHRIASRMPVPLGWEMVLCGVPGPVAIPDLAALADVDPGTTELNPRMIQRFLEEGR
jgi:hypothetical protein